MMEALSQAAGLVNIGEQLQTAREAKKLTLQDVSNTLRYSVKQIEALESNTFHLLPDAMMTRGFIRNYARLVGIEAEPLLASYRNEVPEKALAGLSVQSSTNPLALSKESRPWLLYILATIVVLLFVIAWLFYIDQPLTSNGTEDMDITSMPHNPTIPVEMPASPSTDNPPVEAAMPQAALPAAERVDAPAANAEALADGTAVPAAAPLAATASTQAPLVAATNSAENTVSAAAIDARVLQLQTQLLNMPSTPAALPQVKEAKLAFSASSKSWVSVTDQTGKVVFEKMIAAGNTESFSGTPPFNVVIGNAKSTTLTYQNQPIDIAAQTNGNVARLRLE